MNSGTNSAQGIHFDETQPENDSRATPLILRKDNKDTAFEIKNEKNVDFFKTESRKKFTMTEKSRKLGPTYATINGYDCYRTVQGMHDTMADLALQNHVFVEMRKIGDSWRQKNEDKPLGYDADITAFIISNRHSYKKKAPIFVLCNMIPAQLAPPEFCVRFAEKIIKDRKINGDFAWMLDYSEIHMIYQGNPDGRVYQENNLNEKIYKNRHVETSCLGTSESHIGTNINANFLMYWDQGNDSKCDKMYKGSDPTSEPETFAISSYMNFTVSQVAKQTLSFVIDIHSSNQEIQWPFAASNQEVQKIYKGFAGILAKDTTPLFATSNEPNIIEHGSFLEFAYLLQSVLPIKLGIGTTDFEECSNFDQVYKNAESILLTTLRVAHVLYVYDIYPVVEIISPLDIYPPEFSMKVKVTTRSNETIQEVKLYLNRHPFDLPPDIIPAYTSTDFTHLDNTTSTTILSLPSLRKGTYTVYVQAVAIEDGTDTSIKGPVYAHKFSVDMSATYNPTISPTISISPSTSAAPSSLPTAYSLSTEPTQDFPILNSPPTLFSSPLLGTITNLPTTKSGNSDESSSQPSQAPTIDISQAPSPKPTQDCGLIPFLPIRKRIADFGRYLGRNLIGST